MMTDDEREQLKEILSPSLLALSSHIRVLETLLRRESVTPQQMAAAWSLVKHVRGYAEGTFDDLEAFFAHGAGTGVVLLSAREA
jgi:hypothetical protein